MTVFAATCALAKRIVSSGSLREKIYQSLVDLERASGKRTDKGGEEDPFGRANSVGYLSRQDPHQFKTLLILNRLAKEGQLKIPEPWNQEVTPLSDDDWRAMSSGDHFLCEMNARLLAQLETSASRSLSICDPYANLVDGPRHESSDLLDELFEFAGPQLDALAVVFAGHPSVSGLEFPDGVSDEELFGGMGYLSEALMRLDSYPDSNSVAELRGDEALVGSDQSKIARCHARLYAISRTLQSIDTILFDAFRKSRIAVATTGNMFEISGGDDLLGATAKISLQPGVDDVVHLEPNDIIMLLPPDDGMVTRGPGLVTGSNVSLNQETGFTLKLRLRMLDVWLNPYPGVLTT